jgi:hypothetical protein
MSKSAKARKTKLKDEINYPGELAEPIYEPVLVAGMLYDDTVAKREAQERAAMRRFAKLPALFLFYGIDPNSPRSWLQLALRLAENHVPGMQITHRSTGTSGRPKVWKFGLGTELLRDVEVLRALKGLNISQALQELSQDKTKVWRRYDPPTLAARHREARREEERWQKNIAKQMVSPVNLPGMPEVGFRKPPLKADENS